MANTGKVLVTGATGNVASGLIPALRSAGVEVRALVHDESKAQPLRDQGVEVVIGDLDKPATLDAAVAGVDKIYLLTDNRPNGGQHGINLIDAVKRSGGRPYIVRHGMFGDSRSRIKDGFAKEATDNVERLTGHPARSVETFAHDFAGFFGGSS